MKPALAERITRARETRNLSQVELAAELEVSRRSVQNWEAGGAVRRFRDRRKLEAWLREVEAEMAAA